MKFNKEELLYALESVKPGIANSDIVEQASCFVFKDNNIYTYNDDISVIFPLKHDIKGAVPAKEFYSLISRFREREITIDCVDNNFVIKGIKAKAQMKIKEDLKLPISEVSAHGTWNDIPDDFCDAIDFALLSVSNDLAKPILTCVHWTDKYIESCDNFRLTRISRRTVNGIDKPVLIPGNSMSYLEKYTPVQFSINGGWAHFKSSTGCVFSCRVFEGEYIPLDDIFRKPGTDKIIFSNAMISLLDKVSILAEKDSSDNSKAQVSIVKSVAKVTSANKHLGAMYDEAPVQCEFDIDFDIRTEALKRILECDLKEATIAEDMSTLRFTKNDIVYIIALT